MTQVFIHKTIEEIQQFYGELLQDYWKWSVSEHLELLAKRLEQGYQEKRPHVAQEINNYHPDWLGKDHEVIFRANLTLADMQQTIASEYGFRNWQEVSALSVSYDPNFESALNFLLAGNISELHQLLTKFPDLVNERSHYGHRATLLHYAGSNGVEFWRQQVPMNLREVTEVLLKAGADKEAKMNVYGGEFNTLQLLGTSAHPFQAGVAEEAMEVLK